MKTPFSAVHPATWILAGCSALLLALSPLPVVAQLMLLLVLFIVFILAGFWRKFLIFTLIGMGPVALTALVIQAISYQGNSYSWFSYQPSIWFRFNIGPEGLLYGLRLALQILLFGSASSLIALPNSPEELKAAFTRWRVPSRAVYLLVASLNAPVLLSRTFARVREAQRLRGLNEKGIKNFFRIVLYTSTAMVNLILIENEGRARTLQTRGLDAEKRTLLRVYPDSKTQLIFRWSLLSLSALTALATLWWRNYA